MYQVIGKDIDNPEISIPPQHTDRGHNYGEIGSNTNLNNSTQDGFKSMEFGWTSGFGGSNNVTLTGGSVNDEVDVSVEKVEMLINEVIGKVKVKDVI